MKKIGNNYFGFGPNCLAFQSPMDQTVLKETFFHQNRTGI